MYQEVDHHEGRTYISAILLLVVSNRGQTTHILLTPHDSNCHEFRISMGRWDRNRTGALRLRGLLPFVQLRGAKAA